MFQTLQPQSIRPIKSSLSSKYRKLHINNEFDPRPNTVGFQRKQFQPFSPNKSMFRTLDSAELEITTQFRKQMSPYIKQTIRNSLSRNCKRKLVLNRMPSPIEDPQDLQISTLNHKMFGRTINSLNQTSPMGHVKISTILARQTRSPFKHQQLISQPIITNTKERIDRMIELKKQRDIEYEDLKKSIQRKCFNVKENHHRKISTIIDSKIKNNPPTMEALEWDKQWKDETKKESNRYRNRLISKHKRDMSMKIQLPQNN